MKHKTKFFNDFFETLMCALIFVGSGELILFSFWPPIDCVGNCFLVFQIWLLTLIVIPILYYVTTRSPA